MTKCFCEMCTPNPAPTYTEEFRHQCEVRYVQALSEPYRANYLVMVEEARGADAKLLKEFRRAA